MKSNLKGQSLEQRFWSRVKKTTNCWLWQGHTNAYGYGAIYADGLNRYVHHIVLELLGKKIPTGLQVDHTCRVRNCVNPDHLDFVTSKENTLRGESFSARNARKTHCVRGHKYTTENTYIRSRRSGKDCRICMRFRAINISRLRKKGMLKKYAQEVPCDVPNCTGSYIPGETICNVCHSGGRDRRGDV